MNRLSLLKEILNKTIYLTSAIKSENLDIINNLLEEREELMSLVDQNLEMNTNEHMDVLGEIQKIDQENQRHMLVLNSKIEAEGRNLKAERNGMKKSSKATKKYLQGSDILESTFNKTR